MKFFDLEMCQYLATNQNQVKNYAGGGLGLIKCKTNPSNHQFVQANLPLETCTPSIDPNVPRFNPGNPVCERH